MRGPSDWTTDEKRAVQVYAAFLDAGGSAGSVDLDRVMAQHPDLAEHLDRIDRGNQLLDFAVAYRGETRRRRRSIPMLRVGAAATLVAAASIGWIQRDDDADRRLSVEFARTVDDLVASVREAAGEGEPVDDAIVGSLASIVKGGRLLAEEAHLPEAEPGRLDAADELRAEMKYEQRARYDAIVGAPADQPPELDLGFSTIVAASLPEIAPNEWSSMSPSAKRFLDALLPSSWVALKVIDLDAGGRNTVDVTAWVQRVDLRTGALGPAAQVDSLPYLGPVVPGDYRVTVVDRTADRFSELRFAVAGGETLSLVAFLRATPLGHESMVLLPECTITYGDPSGQEVLHQVGRPCAVPEFWIDRFETTVAEYARFLAAVSSNPQWLEFEDRSISPVPPPTIPPTMSADGWHEPSRANFPVTGVQWRDAVLYANWAGKRLPTDREWERCAEGAEGRRYPWGQIFDASCVDTGPVGAVDGRPRGATPAEDGAVMRLADNVEEWVEDVFVRRDDRQGVAIYCPLGYPVALMRTTRSHFGWRATPGDLVNDRRGVTQPDGGNVYLGFRCARSSQGGVGLSLP